MASEHSPLPWRAQPRPTYVSIVDASGQDAADVYAHNTAETAAYIVRAANAFPALVEALERAVARQRGLCWQSDWLDTAEAALALARGEKP